jgi:hypothetical protein
MTEPPAIHFICERCNVAAAVIHLARTGGRVITTHHYCVACAKAIGVATLTVPARDSAPEPDRS